MVEKKQNLIGKVKPQELTEEMQQSYLDYAMSVIVSRALPDVRDGLKPVQRRILFVMKEMGLMAGARFRKSAAVVGETLAKYHPHGDTAVYDALARLAQDFSLRYPLVEGQGNFGSIDGDPPAAQRYTEVKLTKLAEEMLVDIEKNTVDFIPNYDGTHQEPVVLPAKIPQLLLNGTVGIAVGMATNIPPHNLKEIVDALIFLIDNPKATASDILRLIKGPDFPTGGYIFATKEMKEAYATGRGPIIMRAKTNIVPFRGGSFQIIVTEIPFQVNKADLIARIADLVRDKKIEGIKDIRDESDKEGLRIVIDLKKDTFPQKILNKLFKYTDLQKTFHLNSIALVEGIQPQTLSIKAILDNFLSFRQQVVRRRSEFDLAQAQERAHILAGLKKALDHIDDVVKTIKRSKDKESAKHQLIKKFKLTDRQAGAILEMRLQTLAALERQKIEAELKEKKKIIKELTLILKEPKRLRNLIKEELIEIKKNYGDERRSTVVAGNIKELKEEDLTPPEETLITISFSGFIKRMKPTNYRLQRRGGRGVIGVATSKEDPIQHLISLNTHDWVLFFTSMGRLFQIRAFEIPTSTRQAKGRSIVNFLNLHPNERITAVLPLSEKLSKEDKKHFFVMVTKNGKIKKTPLSEFGSLHKRGLTAIKLAKDDLLRWVGVSSGNDEILLVTKLGQAIRFSEQDIRPMGRAAAGVTALRLKKNDEVVGAGLIKPTIPKNFMLLVTEKGFGKKTKLSQFKRQRRGGLGIKAAKITDKTSYLISATILTDENQDLIVISRQGQVIRIPLAEISVLGRMAQGVRIMKIAQDDAVASTTIL